MPPCSARFNFKPAFWTDLDRRVLQRVIGPVVAGYAPPIPDLDHGPTVAHGCACRYAADLLPINEVLLNEFKQFCRTRAEEMFLPLPADTVFCPYVWLRENTTYSFARKQELMLLYDVNNGVVRPHEHALDGFAKCEVYITDLAEPGLDYKPARGINSRSDMFKLYAGPIFHEIEKVVYKNKAFIKHVPVSKRAAYMRDMFEGTTGPYAITDYTSFERWFGPEIMDACEFQLYEHLLKNFPYDAGELRSVLTGVNRINYRTFNVQVIGKRMSGEMCTSLGNGWTNLMLAEFTAFKCGCEVTGVVEGDDAFLKYSGPVTTDYIEQLGFQIKFEEVDCLERGSFCGLVQSRDGISLVDPYKKLLGFGWSHSRLIMSGLKVRLGLLRSKALSLAYEAPQCPIVWALARRCIDFTEGVKARFEDNYWDSQINRETREYECETMSLLSRGPTQCAREDFAEIYDIPIDLQLNVENEILAWKQGELDGPYIQIMFGLKYHTCRHYYSNYLRSVERY